MMGKRTHPNALDWTKYLAGESGWLAAGRLRRHLLACAPCRQLEAEMAEERRSFDSAPMRRDELSFLQARAAASHRNGAKASPRLRWVVMGGAAAAVVATAIALRAPRRAPYLAEKGRDVFTMYVDRPSGAVALGARCAPGDRVMASYRTERRHLLLLERDGRGAVQVLVPPGGGRSIELPAAEGTTATSWALDAAPGRECFAAVFSDGPIDPAAASRALARSPEAPSLPGAVIRMQCCDKGGPR
jgi:hypothetical protein